MKFNSREMYFIGKPQNLIPKKMHTFLGTKTDKKLT